MTSGFDETAALDEIVIVPMTPADLDEVLAIERCSFPSAWSRGSYERELRSRNSHYFTAHHQGRLLGYVGMWLVLGEAHITTLAVHPHFRRRGLGSRLLRFLIGEARGGGATKVTLEVRTQNQAAISMYRKSGFEQKGVLRGYYGDTGEDGIVMWTLLDPEADREAAP